MIDPATGDCAAPADPTGDHCRCWAWEGLPCCWCASTASAPEECPAAEADPLRVE